MKYFKKHPLIMIVIGVLGIGLSAILVKYSAAPSAVTAASRLIWTVLLMSPAVWGKKNIRTELFSCGSKTVILSIVSGIFLAAHFVLWFESLQHTSVASSTALVCTEVIWVSIGYCLFLKGKITIKAGLAIAIAFIGSVIIAFADSTSEAHLLGDALSLASAIAVAVYMLLGREVRKKASTTVYTYLVYSACALSLLILCVAQDTHLFGYGISPVIVGLLLSAFSTLLGHSIFSWCLKFFSPSFISAAKLLEPVVAALLAVFLFAEIPSPLQILGALFILGGVFWYSRIEKAQ
ncbi:MAG: DMT family transporter [Clostridia bacterium]|nr:DMT family transporter [Clostridia bacterium]